MRDKTALCTRKVQAIQDVFVHVENSAYTGGIRRCNASLDDITAAVIEAAEEGDTDVLYS